MNIIPKGNVFSQVPAANISRSSFDRSHGVKTTFDAGWLIPFYLDEALPGDTFNLNVRAFVRMTTPIYPLMDNLYIHTFFFAVPYRLVWDNFVKMMGEQVDPGDSVDYLVPVMTSPGGGYTENSLEDYFGLPIGVAGVEHTSLFHRAYNLIWAQWFRDQNLQNSPVLTRTDGPDTPADYTLLRRGKRHDYFTSSLPWPQKGDSVDLPLGTVAPVVSDGNDAFFTQGTNNLRLRMVSGVPGVDWEANPTVTSSAVKFSTVSGTGLQADLTNATAATINQLRQAFAIQRLYERDARGGTRYTSIVRSHFAVTSPDARLQRAEYLGGGMDYIQMSVVPQTGESGTTPQGNLSAFATSEISSHGFNKSFTEHCLVMGLVSVRSDKTYDRGMNKMWTRRAKEEFFWPEMQALGEQAVLSKEIYVDGTANDDDVWGYQERYAEYRYKPSIITGQFRTTAAASLDAWILTDEFASRPVLNDTFIQENPPMSRVLAVPSQPAFLMDALINLRCARPMTVYGIPGMLTRL